MKKIYMVQAMIECVACAGIGVIGEQTCTQCGGEGYTAYEEVPLEVALQALGVNLDLQRSLADWQFFKGGEA
jgi:DnaJ-class molecular chaperone